MLNGLGGVFLGPTSVIKIDESYFESCAQYLCIDRAKAEVGFVYESRGYQVLKIVQKHSRMFLETFLMQQGDASNGAICKESRTNRWLSAEMDAFCEEIWCLKIRDGQVSCFADVI